MTAVAMSTFGRSLAARMTALALGLAALSIGVMVTIACLKIHRITVENAEIRIDRAARTAASVLAYAQPETFSVITKEDGSPAALKLAVSNADETLIFTEQFDEILSSIAGANQGAANLFRFNPQTNAFDRFATTFRQPDGSLPPAMSITESHPAFADLRANRAFTGEVPVMGRVRLASLTPIQNSAGDLAGALVIDVGWVDDLQVVRDDLHKAMVFWSAVLLLFVGLFGVSRANTEMRPLRQIAKIADKVASGERRATMPFTNRKDEIGALAQGLSRVFDLQGKLESVAYVDPLTGLGNRARYLEAMGRVIEDANSGREYYALVHVNIDNFTKVNSGLGYETGDRVLKRVAAELRRAFRDAVCITRDGGDDFSIIVRRYGSAIELSSRCQALLVDLKKPIAFDDCTAYLDCSIGIARLPEDATNSEAAHRNADLALHEARDKSDTKVGLFNAELDRAADRRHRIETRLHEAIEQGCISLHYQPQVCGKTHKILGVEALARWEDASEGPISPAEFIPIAEQIGLISKLGNQTLCVALKQAALWRQQGLPFGHVSVNVSPHQLWQAGFVDQVRFLLDTCDLPGSALCLEITESIFIAQDDARVAALLESLRQLGVQIALDDFGAGYSSLGYLNHLPCDTLKIDRGFIKGVPEDAGKAKLVRGMIALGQGLGLTVVAEGAETRGEVEFLTQSGCDAIQGFYFAKPQAVDDLPGALQHITSAGRLAVPERRFA